MLINFGSSLFVRLLSSFIIVALIPIVFTIYRDATETKQAINKSNYLSLRASSLKVNQTIDHFINQQVDRITLFSHLIIEKKLKTSWIDEAPRAKFQALLTDFSNIKVNQITPNSVAIYNNKGQIIVASTEDIDNNISSNPIFNQLFHTNNHYKIGFNQNKLQFVVKIFDAAGISSILLVDFLADDLKSLIPLTANTGLIHILINEKYQSLINISDNGHKITQISTEQAYNLNKHTKNTPYFIQLDQEKFQTEYAAHLTPISHNNWAVVTLENSESFLKPMSDIFRTSIWLILITLGLVILVASAAASLFAQPIVDMTKLALKMAHGNLTLRVETPSKDEIGTLAKAFNYMAERLARRNQELKRKQQQLKRAQTLAKCGSFELSNEKLMFWSDELFTILELEKDNSRPKLATLIKSLGDKFGHEFEKQLTHLTTSSTQESCMLESWLTLPSGIEKYLVIKIEKDSTGEDFILMGTVNDVTEEKLAQAELKQSQERLSYALEATNDGMWDWNLITNQVYFSPRWFEMLGYKANELPATLETFQFLIDPQDKSELEEIITKIITGESFEIDHEFRMINKSGTSVWIHSRGTTVEFSNDNTTTRMVGTHTNVTERKNIEQKLTKLNEELENRVNERTQQLEASHEKLTSAKNKAELANKTKSDFLANMSHEIRTPLNAIVGLSNLLTKTTLNPIQKRHVKNIEKSSENLLSIINDILDFSKIEAGKLTIENVSFNLSEILSNISDIFAHKAHQKGLEFIVNIDPSVPTYLIGDPYRLNQIITNLLSNSLKFTHQGQIEIQIKIVMATDYKVTIKFSVTDTGIGLTESQKTKLFNSFTQADTSTTREYGGTGLGLTICRQLCHLMDGEINIEDKQTSGSTFSFIIPFKIDSTPKAVLELTVAEHKNSRVLVIDDNCTNADMITSMLTTFGLKATCGYSGEDAISICDTAQDYFDICILDWQMPSGLTGKETIHALQQHDQCKNAQFIIMHNTEISPSIAKELNDETLISLYKPINSSQLFKIITRILNNQPIHQKHEVEITPISSDKFTQIKVLLVEDNEINQEIAQALLSYHGMAVTIAENGQVAVDMLNKALVDHFKFDIVLMDIQMPVMDGYEATKQIRQIPEYTSLPIIAMTANAMTQDKDLCLASGMNDHIGKPINEKLLLDTISDWLGRDCISPELKEAQEINLEQVKISNEIKPNESIDKQYQGFETFDIEFAKNQLAGNINLLLKMMNRFNDEFSTYASQIAKDLAENETDNAKNKLHTLKGVAGNLGLQKLHHICKDFEHEIKQNQVEELDYYLAQLNEIIVISLQAAEDFCQDNNVADKSRIKLAEIEATRLTQIKQQIATLKTMLANDEFISEDDLSILQPLAQTEHNQIYQTLLDAIENFEGQAANEALAEIMKLLE